MPVVIKIFIIKPGNRIKWHLVPDAGSLVETTRDPGTRIRDPGTRTRDPSFSYSNLTQHTLYNY